MHASECLFQNEDKNIPRQAYVKMNISTNLKSIKLLPIER